MSYIEGFVAAVPTAHRVEYQMYAAFAEPDFPSEAA
jgi:uncharacterized protein YbaA (DUF1428 family)